MAGRALDTLVRLASRSAVKLSAAAPGSALFSAAVAYLVVRLRSEESDSDEDEEEAAAMASSSVNRPS